jgi:hypothetical protein
VNISSHAPTTAAAVLFCSSCLFAADEYEQQLPLKFTKLNGLVLKANGLTLASQVKQLGDDENQYGGGYGARCDKDAFGGPGLTLGFYYNAANAGHKRLVLHARPTVGDRMNRPAKHPALCGKERGHLAYLEGNSSCKRTSFSPRSS